MSEPSEKLLEQYMRQALEEAEDSAQLFFKELLGSELYVIEREQGVSLSHMPQYPNDFVSVMGVQTEEQVIIPAFTHPRYVEEWFGTPLKYKTIHTSKLLQLVPADWWICVNPGREIEKELSPWEIEQLKLGEPGIRAVIEELYSVTNHKSLELEAFSRSELPALTEALDTFCKSHRAIKTLFVAKEKNELDGPESTLNLRLGVVAQDLDAEQIKTLQFELQALTEKHLIGHGKATVVGGLTLERSVLLNMFSHFDPFYRISPPTLWNAIKQWFKM